MSYDTIISSIGEFGKYQRGIFSLLIFPAIFTALHTMAGVFLAAKTNFRCLLPDESLENATFSFSNNITKLIAYPLDKETNSASQCERNESDFLNSDTDFDKNSSLPIFTCESFVYDKTTYTLTTVTEFNLVCENEWLKAAADSVYMVGMMLGAIIFGGLSDKFGRRPILFLSSVLNVISGTLVAISPAITYFIIFRLIVATSVAGMFLTAYVLAIETSGPKMRSMVGVGMFLFFTIGSILTTGFAYFIRNWRILQIVITVPSCLFLLSWWFVPESVRWLLSKGRAKDAKKSLLKIASKNGKQLSRDTLDGMFVKTPGCYLDLERPSILDLVRYPNLRRKTLLLSIIWLVTSSTYYGLSWNTSNLGGDNFINFAISGCVEIPAHLVVFLLLNKWGRRIVLCGCSFLAGVSLLLTAVVPAGMSWIIIPLTMIGKSAITGSFSSSYVFAAEQYPTVIRNVGVGTCTTFARIGGIIAPIIIYYSIIWKPLPLVIFGGASLITSLLVLLLPETLHKKLPDSIQEGEQFGT